MTTQSKSIFAYFFACVFSAVWNFADLQFFWGVNSIPPNYYFLTSGVLGFVSVVLGIMVIRQSTKKERDVLLVLVTFIASNLFTVLGVFALVIWGFGGFAS